MDRHPMTVSIFPRVVCSVTHGVLVQVNWLVDNLPAAMRYYRRGDDSYSCRNTSTPCIACFAVRTYVGMAPSPSVSRIRVTSDHLARVW